jgi:hypothetical protein
LPADPDTEVCPGAGTLEAVALFVARAADAGVQLEDTAQTRRLVFDLCRRLDGMPFALELAAVRLRTIGLEELIDRLSDRFAVLTGGSRAALPRQQTLLAAIDWSHDLLSGPEAALLRRLGVFPSDFGLEAAKAVAVGTGIDRPSVLEFLSSLIEKSFVVRLGAAASARYRLHETMREYSLLKLRAAAEELAVLESALRKLILDRDLQPARRWPPRRRLDGRGPAEGRPRVGDPTRPDPLQHLQLAASRRRGARLPRPGAELTAFAYREVRKLPRLATARKMIKRITAPTKAATRPPTVNMPLLTGSPASPASQPPRNAPRMPTTMSQRRPIPRPVSTLLARNPAIAPTTIQINIPICL